MLKTKSEGKIGDCSENSPFFCFSDLLAKKFSLKLQKLIQEKLIKIAEK